MSGLRQGTIYFTDQANVNSVSLPSAGHKALFTQSNGVFVVDSIGNTTRLDDYELIHSVSGALEATIIDAMLPVHQGDVGFGTVSNIYTVSHETIDVSASFPIVSLVVPLSSSNIYSVAINNRTPTSFDIVLSGIPDLSGYKVNWLLLGENGLGGQVNSGGGSTGVDVQYALTATALLASQIAASRMGLENGWIDSLLDISGLNETNSIGSFGVPGQVSAIASGIATPIMTSNTTPSGVVSADSSFSANYAPWEAFSRTNVGENDCWLTDAPTLAISATWRWLRYDFITPKTISEFSITTRDYVADTHPKTWILQGSNDELSWVDLYSATNDTAWTSNQTRSFTCTSIGAYRYYQLLVKEATGNQYIAIGELTLMEMGSAMSIETIPSTVSGVSEYFVVAVVNSNRNFTIEVDSGAGWAAVTTNRTVISPTTDQLSGVISHAGGSTVKVRVTAENTSGTIYGLSLFWK